MPRNPLLVAASLAEREHALIRSRAGYPVPVAGPPDKLRALRDAVLALTGAGVSHALIGGLAVGIRSGVPRATLDVDLAVSTSADRSKVAESLATAGFTLTGRFEHSVNFQHESGEPLQLAFDPGFDAMIARAEAVELDGLSLPVVTKDDLIAMKRRSAADPKLRRSKALRDQADIALLEGDVPEPGEGW